MRPGCKDGRCGGGRLSRCENGCFGCLRGWRCCGRRCLNLGRLLLLLLAPALLLALALGSGGRGLALLRLLGVLCLLLFLSQQCCHGCIGGGGSIGAVLRLQRAGSIASQL